MPKAFILINVELGYETEVLKQLREVPDVMEAALVYGACDIAAKVETDSEDRLKDVIGSKVRRVDRVRSTLTTIVIEGKQDHRSGREIRTPTDPNCVIEHVHEA
jgi:DNA-binding Lrp family transcriptional regulator